MLRAQMTDKTCLHNNAKGTTLRKVYCFRTMSGRRKVIRVIICNKQIKRRVRGSWRERQREDEREGGGTEEEGMEGRREGERKKGAGEGGSRRERGGEKDRGAERERERERERIKTHQPKGKKGVRSHCFLDFHSFSAFVWHPRLEGKSA